MALVAHELALKSTSTNYSWIIDPGATWHICKELDAFSDCLNLSQLQEISLGDGYIVNATGKGTVLLDIAVL